MHLIRERFGDYLVLIVDSGRIDSTNSTELQALIYNEITAGAKRIIIDLSSVDFMDSSGLAGLLPVIKTLPEKGNLMLTGLSPRVSQLFKLTKLDEIFDIYSSVEEALQSRTESSDSAP